MISVELRLKSVGSLKAKEVAAIANTSKYLIKTNHSRKTSADGVQRACIGVLQKRYKLDEMAAISFLLFFQLQAVAIRAARTFPNFTPVP